MQGQELYPAVQFYSSGRTVRLLSMEVSGVTAASVVTVTTPVASLDETSSFVGYGSLGKLGDLGFTFAASRKVSVNCLALAQSISMHPPVNHDGKVCSIRVCVLRVYSL